MRTMLMLLLQKKDFAAIDIHRSLRHRLMSVVVVVRGNDDDEH